MSKFVVVKTKPTELKKGDYLIDTPSFMDEIKLHSAKRPRNGLTGTHYIRMVTDSIAQKYDPENMTAYAVKSHLYEGLPIPNDEAFDAIMVRALQASYPAVFTKYLEHKIRNRPADTERVVYVDSKIPFQYETFYRNGLSEEKTESPKKEKSDKVVGKPAITNEEAKKLKENQEQED